jgi:hypothetical protein
MCQRLIVIDTEREPIATLFHCGDEVSTIENPSCDFSPRRV